MVIRDDFWTESDGIAWCCVQAEIEDKKVQLANYTVQALQEPGKRVET